MVHCVVLISCYLKINTIKSWKREKANGVAKGVQVRPRAQALGAQQQTFCSHLKCVLSRN